MCPRRTIWTYQLVHGVRRFCEPLVWRNRFEFARGCDLQQFAILGHPKSVMHDAVGLIEAGAFGDLYLAFSIEPEPRGSLQDINHLEISHMGVNARLMVG